MNLDPAPVSIISLHFTFIHTTFDTDKLWL
jgi:hypothetical protein